MLQGSPKIQDAVHATLVFELDIPAPVGGVFAAFADANARAVWSAPKGDIVIYDHEEFREGCQDHFRCGPKHEPNVHGITYYWNIVPNQRIVSSESITMDGVKLAVSTSTIELSPSDGGTKLKSTVQIVSFIGQEMFEGFKHGNKSALDGLARYLCQT